MESTSRRNPWPIIRDVLAFAIGGFILLHQELTREESDVTLVVVGFACLGLTTTGIVQRLLTYRLDPRVESAEEEPRPASEEQVR